MIVGSPNVNPGYKLVKNAAYPQIAQDYEQHVSRVEGAAVRRVSGCARGLTTGWTEKFARVKDGAANPFVDPDGYKSYVAEREQAFREEWKKQQDTRN